MPLLRHDNRGMTSRIAGPEEMSLQVPAEDANDGADVTCRGRAFQILEAATGKARSPTVDSQDSRVRRTVSDSDEAERRRRRASVSSDWQSSSARYDGATYPCRHL